MTEYGNDFMKAAAEAVTNTNKGPYRDALSDPEGFVPEEKKTPAPPQSTAIIM